MRILTLPKEEREKKQWEEYSSESFDFGEQDFIRKEKERLAQKFSEYYFQIENKDIKKEIASISSLLKSGKIKIIVPMKEKDGTIENFLNYAIKRLPPCSIIIVNDGSKKEVLDIIKRFKNIYLIDKEEILDLIDWEKLLPILNLSQKPKGKGMAVLAGYLFYFLLKKRPGEDWLFQIDADIKDHEKFQPLEFLSWGILRYPESSLVKIAKGGRNNESHMSVRSALTVLEDLELVIEDPKAKEISKRAVSLFENLGKYKWILGGTFALPEEVAFERPFATGYLEETLICAFVEDLVQERNGFSVQISNPNPCLDGFNSFQKENIILQITANFVFSLALARKPVSCWNLEDIAQINKNFMTKPRRMAFIPSEENQGPVIAEVVANERIFPSIKMLIENNLIKKF